MRNFILFIAAAVGIFCAIWLALAVAGTDWSIPYALVGIVVTLYLIRRTA